MTTNPNLDFCEYIITGYMSTNPNNRNILIEDNSVTLDDIANKAKFASIFLSGMSITPGFGMYLNNSFKSISNNEFSVIYTKFEKDVTKSVTINFRKNGSFIDIYQSDATYWDEKLNVYTYFNIGKKMPHGATDYGVTSFKLYV